ncbi:TnsA endonuclease N-terminal domain-containing protein [Marinimicrobium sp. C2-29]|uniref:TnsA endonuclease N-terminal domain-containing protein n=1 Tax=Marinimicrobium sp. C2-29 TaxID=3139825 RepID=UPI003138719D
MAIRNVLSRSRLTNRHLIRTPKSTKPVACESTLERNVALWIDFSSCVACYEEQPAVIHFEVDGTPARTIPDFLLTFVDGTQAYVEVKYAKEAQKKARRLSAIGSALAEHYNMAYWVVTEATIRNEKVVIENCSYFQKFVTLDDDRLAELERVAADLPAHPFLLSDLIGLCDSDTTALELIANQFVFHDFSQFIAINSPLCQAGDSDYQYFNDVWESQKQFVYLSEEKQ